MKWPAYGSYNDCSVLHMCDATKLLLSTAIVLTLLVPSLAQQDPNSPLGTRSVLANVLDARGNAVRDLNKEDFRVSVNGRRIPVFDARYSLAPRRIVVLLDMSGSMTEPASKKWQIAQQATDDVLTQTPRDVPVALLTFAGNVHDVFDFSRNRTDIDRWLKADPGQKPKLKYPAKTALFDAILQGLKLLNPVQNGDAIYAVTDGDDNASGVSARQTEAALLRVGVRLFVFLLAEPQPYTELQDKRDSLLSTVDDSGGFVFGLVGRQKPFRDYLYDSTTRENMTAETRELNILVHGFWTLDLTLPDLTKKGRVKLELVNRKEKARRDFTLIYQRELFAPR